jgi:hypothetical protein
MSQKAENVPMTELLDHPNRWIGKQVSTIGYFVEPHIYINRRVRERRYESLAHYLARCEAASLNVSVGYLVDIADVTGPEPWHVVDEQKETYLINDWWLFAQNWQWFWPIARPIYRYYRHGNSSFPKVAIEINAPELSLLLNAAMMKPVLFSAYSRKFPASITGTISASRIPQFKVEIRNITQFSQLEHQVRKVHFNEVDIYNSI